VFVNQERGDVVEDVVPCEVAVGFPIDKEFRDVPVAGHVVVDQAGPIYFSEDGGLMSALASSR
jgi:hypothetical protein